MCIFCKSTFKLIIQEEEGVGEGRKKKTREGRHKKGEKNDNRRWIYEVRGIENKEWEGGKKRRQERGEEGIDG